MQTIEQPREVLVVLDLAFGERLRDFWSGRAVWIATSAINDAIVGELLSANDVGLSHLVGTSGLTHYAERGDE